MRRALAVLLAALVAAATVALAVPEAPEIRREAGRPAPITSDIIRLPWDECSSGYAFELGTSTTVTAEVDGERLVITVSGSPADGPLEAALQSCLDRYRFAPMTEYLPASPLERLLLGAYTDSTLQNCIAAHGFAIEPMEPWQIVGDDFWTRANPYVRMSGDPSEIAELRRDCPPYPAFLVPDTPVR